MSPFQEYIEKMDIQTEMYLFGYKPEKRLRCSRTYITIYPNEETVLTPTYREQKRFMSDLSKVCDKHNLDIDEVLAFNWYPIQMTI